VLRHTGAVHGSGSGIVGEYTIVWRMGYERRIDRVMLSQSDYRDINEWTS
jgi:hypothetical protein